MGSSLEKFPLPQACQSGPLLFSIPLSVLFQRLPYVSNPVPSVFSRTQPSGCADFKVEMHEKAVNGARRKEDRGVQGGWRGGDKEMARKRAGGKAASYHEHETTLNHKTSHRP